MKKILLAFILCAGFATTASAQKKFSVDEFSKNLGKTGTLCDTVSSVRIFSDTLTLLNMGGMYPNQKYTVAVKGNKVALDFTTLKGKPLCVTGVFLMFKNRPEIVVSE